MTSESKINDSVPTSSLDCQGKDPGSARRTVSEFGVGSSNQKERFLLGVYKGSRLFQLLLSKHMLCAVLCR